MLLLLDPSNRNDSTAPRHGMLLRFSACVGGWKL